MSLKNDHKVIKIHEKKNLLIANKYFVNLGTGNLSGLWPSYDLDANS